MGANWSKQTEQGQKDRKKGWENTAHNQMLHETLGMDEVVRGRAA